MNEEEHHESLEKFQEAIKALLEEHEYGGFLGDWMLITAQGHVHSDGSTGTSYSTFVNRHQAVHTAAGLLRYATIKNEMHIIDPEG